MRINVLHEGDEVIGVTNDFVAVRRNEGVVDLIPIVRDVAGLRIDVNRIITIGYGENTVSSSEVDGVVVTTF